MNGQLRNHTRIIAEQSNPLRIDMLKKRFIANRRFDENFKRVDKGHVEGFIVFGPLGVLTAFLRPGLENFQSSLEILDRPRDTTRSRSRLGGDTPGIAVSPDRRVEILILLRNLLRRRILHEYFRLPNGY